MARDSVLAATIAPWLEVNDGNRAIAFFRGAFGAEERYRLIDDAGSVVVARLSIGGAEFWVQEDSDAGTAAEASGRPIRLILTVNDPDALFRQALAAGAIEIAPVAEEHGWRVGRLVDPFGHHWEVGTPLDN